MPVWLTNIIGGVAGKVLGGIAEKSISWIPDKKQYIRAKITELENEQNELKPGQSQSIKAKVMEPSKRDARLRTIAVQLHHLYDDAKNQ